MRTASLALLLALTCCSIPHSLTNWANDEDSIRDTTLIGTWLFFDPKKRVLDSSLQFFIDTAFQLHHPNGRARKMYDEYEMLILSRNQDDETHTTYADSSAYRLAYFKLNGSWYIDGFPLVNMAKMQGQCNECIIAPMHCLYKVLFRCGDTATIGYYDSHQVSRKMIHAAGADVVRDDCTFYGNTAELRKLLTYLSKHPPQLKDSLRIIRISRLPTHPRNFR